jgi:hypothetical protein
VYRNLNIITDLNGNKIAVVNAMKRQDEKNKMKEGKILI